MGLINDLPQPPKGKTGWPWTEEQDPNKYNANTKWPKFTIIIPCFNHGNYIEETIRSILLQNYPNTELIVIDGGSKDETVAILEKYDSWIEYWESEKDRGQSHAINKGINKTTGELFNWINSDDSLTKNALYDIASFFIANADVDLIYGNSNIVYPGIKTEIYKSVDFDEVDFISRISIHQPSTFWRTKLFKEVGLVKESFHFCMDYDLWARIVFNYKSAKLDKVLSNFRRYPESKSSNFEDQSKVYLDYRRVASRILASIDESFIEKTKALGIYYNDENERYTITRKIAPALKQKMLNQYIMTCMMQEYILENRKKTNELLKHCFNKSYKKETIVYFFKNNFGFRKLFHPYRKT